MAVVVVLWTDPRLVWLRRWFYGPTDDLTDGVSGSMGVLRPE